MKLLLQLRMLNMMKQTDTHIEFDCVCEEKIEIKKSDFLKENLMALTCSKCCSISFIKINSLTNVVFLYTQSDSIEFESDCSICDGGQSGICYGEEAHGKETN